MAIVFNGNLEEKFIPPHTEAFDANGDPWVNTYDEWEQAFQLEHDRFPCGDPMPESYFAAKVRLLSEKKLHQFTGFTGGGLACGEQLKDLIEGMEPGVHQFVPVEVVKVDGSAYGEPFWFFHICTCLDAINPDSGGVKKQFQTPFPDENPDAFRWKIASGGRDKLAVHKGIVAGRAAWEDKRAGARRFFSDELVEKINAAGIQGWEASEIWREL